MGRIRFLIFLATVIIVGTVGYFLSYYAKGYVFDFKTFKFQPNGLLVIKSNPDGAQVYVDGELKTATNSTVNLGPGTYDIKVRKEGYNEWAKRLTIQKEIVTEADAHLFRSVPSLSAITFSGVANPLASHDFTKIAYIVPLQKNINTDKSGLWLMETVNLPLGFSRDPRRITDGDLTNAKMTWSPDGREMLVQMPTSAYILDIGKFTPQSERVNILPQLELITADWASEESRKSEAQIKQLPPVLADIFTRKTSSVVFSPDESKILYTVKEAATIPSEIIKPIPGASTQKEEREIKPGRTYVYDLKEDRNFMVDEDSKDLSIEVWKTSDKTRRLFWFATSRHMILAEDSKVIVMDLDGTNRQAVYSGSYIAPNALVAPNTDRLFILTNLGAETSTPNLYTVSLK